jgi:hypothetical protein
MYCAVSLTHVFFTETDSSRIVIEIGLIRCLRIREEALAMPIPVISGGSDQRGDR